MMVRKVVVKMHQRGVVHGDLHADNVKYDERTGQCWVFDFSHSTTSAMVGKEAFCQLCQEELAHIDKQIHEADARCEVAN